MGIKVHCPNGHELHVKSFLAGKRGICPECGARFSIPVAAGPGAPPPILDAAVPPPIPQAQPERIRPVAALVRRRRFSSGRRRMLVALILLAVGLLPALVYVLARQ